MKFTRISFATSLLAALFVSVVAHAQPSIDGDLGSDQAPRLQKKRVRNVAHSKAPFTVEGDFTLDPAKTPGTYRGIKAEDFGTTVVMLPDPRPTSETFGKPIPATRVRDLHYVMGTDADGNPLVGIRPIPISEPHSDGSADDTSKPGSYLIDQFLRQHQGLGPNDPIFATIVYLHPELHSGGLEQLASEALKTEHGQTHLGMYLGEGFTRNSPEGYHSRGWKVKGYPATVQVISLDGVDQATLNRNGHIASAILNDGVEFPSDYKNDVYQTVTLGRTLQFYRWWLEGNSKLKDENAWKTYCAEHVTIVTNIMLNVPHNEAAFKKIWGDADGARLWGLARAKYAKAMKKTLAQSGTIKGLVSAGAPLPGFEMELIETDFEPLYVKDGISEPASFGASDTPKLEEIGPGLAWPPEHNSDLVVNFLEVYASWPDVGAAGSAAALLAFKKKIVERMLNTEQEPAEVKEEADGLSKAFDQVAFPAITKMFIAEAMTKKPGRELRAYAQQAPSRLYIALGGKPEDLRAGSPDPIIWGAVQQIQSEVIKHRRMIVQAAVKGTSKDEAYAWFKSSVAEEVKLARRVNVSNPNKVVRFNSPPAVTHRVASGLHPRNAHVTISEVATVFEAEELITKEELAARIAAEAEAANETSSEEERGGPRHEGAVDRVNETTERTDNP